MQTFNCGDLGGFCANEAAMNAAGDVCEVVEEGTCLHGSTCCKSDILDGGDEE